MKVNTNDRVRVVRGDPAVREYTDNVGIVERTYPTIEIAIVSFDNGCVGKIHFSNLVKVETEPEENIPEGAKFITREAYNKALKKITDASDSKDIIATLLGVVVGNMISDKIFNDSEVVAMTKNQFIERLWSECSPVSISKFVNEETLIETDIYRSVTAIIVLKPMIDILFDESEVE